MVRLSGEAKRTTENIWYYYCCCINFIRGDTCKSLPIDSRASREKDKTRKQTARKTTSSRKGIQGHVGLLVPESCLARGLAFSCSDTIVTLSSPGNTPPYPVRNTVPRETIHVIPEERPGTCTHVPATHTHTLLERAWYSTLSPCTWATAPPSILARRYCRSHCHGTAPT